MDAKPIPSARSLAPHVQASLAAVQRKAAGGNPGHGRAPASPQPAPHVQAAVQMKPRASAPPAARSRAGSAGRVVQRALERNEYSTSKKKRVFDSGFLKSHLRNAQDYTSESAMRTVAVDIYKDRKVLRNTVVFMTPYQQQVFLEQQHTHLGQDPVWTGYDVFQSTTQFPLVDISSSGSITVHSAAQFRYSAYYDENEGVWVVTHMKGL